MWAAPVSSLSRVRVDGKRQVDQWRVMLLGLVSEWECRYDSSAGWRWGRRHDVETLFLGDAESFL